MKKLIALSCLTAIMLAGCGVDEPAESISKPDPVRVPTTEAATEPETEPPTTAATTRKTKPATTKATTTTAATTATAATTTTAGGSASFADRMNAYPDLYAAEVRRVWDDIYDKNDGVVSIDYATYDLDADGIPELMFKFGTCEADYMVNVYTVDGDAKLKTIGELSGSHVSFAKDYDTGEFVLAGGHMGYGGMRWLTMENGLINEVKNDSFEFRDSDDFEARMMDEGVYYLDYIHAYSFDKESEPKSYVMYAYSEYEELDGLYIDFGYGWASH